MKKKKRETFSIFLGALILHSSFQLLSSSPEEVGVSWEGG
jgi:hypothetical protein